MKKNILRKVSILGLAALMLFIPNFTNAEEVCTTHKNYYLYSLIDEVPGFVNGIYKSEGNTKVYYYSAYFPRLPEDAMPAVNNRTVLYGRICLTKDGVADGTGNQCAYTWSLEDYYNIQAEISENIEKITFYDNGKKWTSGVYSKRTENENGNRVVEYYYGGASWFKCQDDACSVEQEGGAGANSSSLSANVLINGSYLPTKTEISFSPADSSKSIIKRTINAKTDFLDYLTYDEEGNPQTDENGDLIINTNSQKVVPFSLAWQPGQTPRNSLLAPAVYYVEYQTCGEEYEATINYYYYKDGKTTEERVEFDNNEENPYVESELEPGYSHEKNSPEKKGCTIVDTKGNKYDTDKIVTISIDKTNPKNFTKDVYYYCPAEEEAKQNNKTGDALIYLAWAIGLGAIGYSAYYLKKLKKEEI